MFIVKSPSSYSIWVTWLHLKAQNQSRTWESDNRLYTKPCSLKDFHDFLEVFTLLALPLCTVVLSVKSFICMDSLHYSIYLNNSKRAFYFTQNDLPEFWVLSCHKFSLMVKNIHLGLSQLYQLPLSMIGWQSIEHNASIMGKHLTLISIV